MKEIEINGVKATNLTPFKDYTPFFIVLETSHFNDWIEGQKIKRATNKEIVRISEIFKSRGVDRVILRSSAISEDLSSRGRFESFESQNSPLEIAEKISEIFTHYSTKGQSGIAVIIQEYRKPIIRGHASNERRISKDKENWYAEYEYLDRNNTGRFDFKVKSADTDPSITFARNFDSVKRSLEAFCSYIISDSYRAHIEWVWDGTKFWIVQIDYDFNSNPGTPPGSELKIDSENVDLNFEILEKVENTKNSWHKIEVISTLKKLKLPYWSIYVLEDISCKKNLQDGLVDVELMSDLTKVHSRPIIIRTEILNDDVNVLLPRTTTLFHIKGSVEFLKEKSKYFKESGLGAEDYCFLIHQFVPSTSCALALGNPDRTKVRIDSNWGIVDGIYYNPHDSWEIDLESRDISEQVRCKDKYVDVNEKGEWYFKESGYKYDWKDSLTKTQISQIAEYTHEIAKELDRPVTVMFFINSKRNSGYPEILPWYYGKEIPPETTHEYQEIFISDLYEINSKKDFENLKKRASSDESLKIQLKIGLDVIRDNDFIKEIATYLKSKNCVVYLEGSFLSHPYYILDSAGVQVRCRNPLEASYKTKKFYKLVRDKIPVYIESKDEQVNSEVLPPQKLLEYLKIKAVEEAFELYWEESNDGMVEEMADIYEVLLGLCNVHGISFEEIQKIADSKREKRGGFEKGVFLIATKENSLIKLGSDQELFIDSKIDKSLRKRSIGKPFKKGVIDKLRTLNELDEIKRLRYLNHPKGTTERFLLKEDSGKLMTITYHEDGINIKFSDLDFEDPDQMELFAE